jgi:pimeloyl-ACP methyl ester carboxylesterase
MAFFSSAIAILLLSSLSVINAQSAHKCTSFFVPVTVTNVTTLIPPFPYPFKDGYAATALSNFITARDTPAGSANLTTLTATFNISAEYCTPNQPTAKSSTLQLLSHGLGFNKAYWDFHLPTAPKNNTYSYISAALAAGYSTFSYDRLGCGLSTQADPYTEIQATVELAVLATLTTAIRTGKIPKSILPTPPTKVLHVGHSWGSELSNALAATFPALSDGVVLTGYSHIFQYELMFVGNTAFHLASESQPSRFANRSSGYLTWGDKYDNQYSFFSYPYFDPKVLTYAESTKFPFTIGEFISQAALNYSASAFTGDVLFLAAQHDLIFCGGDCVGLYGTQSAAREAFPNAKSWERYIQPNVGHGINLHYNASGAYGVIMNWAEQHGF